MDEDAVLRSVETFGAAPDRKQVAALVCDLIESRKAARTKVFELGCFGGVGRRCCGGRAPSCPCGCPGVCG